MSGADKSDCASWCGLPADHDGTCCASDNAARDDMMRRLYRLHRLHVGAPLGERDDTIPTTRGDLREYYSAILDGKVKRPEWAVSHLQ